MRQLYTICLYTYNNDSIIWTRTLQGIAHSLDIFTKAHFLIIPIFATNSLNSTSRICSAIWKNKNSLVLLPSLVFLVSMLLSCLHKYLFLLLSSLKIFQTEVKNIQVKESLSVHIWLETIKIHWSERYC